MKQSQIRMTIPASAEYLDIIRTTLYAVASKAGFSYEDIEDMKVAVTEACANAIQHAYEDRTSNGQVDLMFQWDEEDFVINVKDDGRSFEPGLNEKSMAGLQNIPLSEATAGGLGIFLMKALMDEVEVRTAQGTEVVLTKRMSRNEEKV
ncbi:anti-sigma B factor RsbW [Paenibacillus sp. HB172176]|uniref:anti-sigma B factor RsbW n=1 Tax=Paenibacillus sp. HB172176 TaxID=2493690 RepID=UPI001439B55C|nr:anti-sigma B factor RsbW [Paenibacillus sp. HB172176]